MQLYVLKRLLLIFPTLVVVLLIAFTLSKFVPGDQAESLLVLQGVTPDSKSSAVEYKRNYIALGLDKPTFYFSIIPDFYPGNINSIVDPIQRYQTKTFLNQKISYSNIIKYISHRDIVTKTLSNSLGDTIRYDEKWNHLTKLSFSTNISEIQSECRALEIMDSSEPFVTLRKYADALDYRQNKVFLPSFHWHGANNQFNNWAIQAIKGNFGLSLKDGRSVSEKISSAIKWTIILLVLNLFFTFLIAVPTGIYSGFYQNSLFDKINNIIWLVLYSIPVFWLASMMIIYFTSSRYGAWMNIFPTPGMWYIPTDQSIWITLYQYSGQLVLPVFCLVANDIAQLGRICRNNVIVQKSKQYVLLAKAKGLTSIQVLIKHILPNVWIPLITVIGGKIPAGLSGALLIEVIFNIPGMGRLMYDSIFSTDWNVVFGILVVVSFFTIVFMLLTDILYSWVNPKISHSSQ